MRRKPYTAIGIRRMRCFRSGCENRAHATWQICADGNVCRPICEACDSDLNRMVLEWAGVPDVEAKMAAYEARR